MQHIGHVVVGGQLILLLVRRHETFLSLRVRETGKEGPRLEDEEIFLQENSEVRNRLLKGEVCKL